MLDRDRLAECLASGWSLDDIARTMDCSPSTVSSWLKRHGLEANGAAKYGPKPALDREVLAGLVSQGFSIPDMARRLDCTTARVRYWLRRHGLQSRQGDNRAAAREAVALGQRRVELTCRHHGQVVHVLEGRGSYRCTVCRAAQVAEHRRKLKRLLIAEAGGYCRLCGYDRCEAALQFHHLDPTQKSFHLSLRGITRSLARVREEARKCVLLCATCHAEVEAGFSELSL